MFNTDVSSCLYLAHAPKDFNRLRPLLEKLWHAGFSTINLGDDKETVDHTTPESESPAALIAAADQMVFALSPRSANSPGCQREIDIALQLNKRITPVVITELNGAPVPIKLSRLDYIFFTPPTDFTLAFNALAKALMLDIQQVQEHMHFGAIALSWEQSDRNQQQLLTGAALKHAEQWLLSAHDRKPAPARLQREFIAASRQLENQRIKSNKTLLLGMMVLLIVSSAYGAVLLFW